MYRRIYLTGEIDTAAYEKLSRSLFKACKHNVNVDLVLSSVGGDVYDALAIYDIIIGHQDSIKIDTIATGLVASAATLILAAGTRRHITANTWVMVHEDSPTVGTDIKVSELERAAKHSRRLENQWNTLMARHTKLTVAEWEKLNLTDLYLTPEECLAYGLVDEII